MSKQGYLLPKVANLKLQQLLDHSSAEFRFFLVAHE